MKNFKFDKKDAVLLLFMLVTAVWRVVISSGAQVSVLSNFTPLGAMALFGGVYFTRAKAFAFPLLTIWMSDIALNLIVFKGQWVFFYEGFAWVYGAFALMVLVGRWLEANKSVARFLESTAAIVFIHWIVSDIGVWLSGTTYPSTAQGLWACLVAAIPFELRFLASTVLYGGILFGSFEWFSYKIPALRTSAETSAA